MLAIFDLDGTLLDSLEDLADSSNHILGLHGYPPHPVEAYRYFVGDGIRKLVERTLPEEARRDEVIDVIYKEFLEYYAIHKMDKTQPYAGIVALLEGLQAKGVKLAVASNKAHEAMAPLMAHFFPTIRFTAVLGNKPGARPKPDPGIVLEIMRIAQEDTTTTVYAGDSGVDMETAARAGLRKVGVLWGYRTKEELLAAGADWLLPRPELAAFCRILEEVRGER